MNVHSQLRPTNGPARMGVPLTDRTPHPSAAVQTSVSAADPARRPVGHTTSPGFSSAPLFPDRSESMEFAGHSSRGTQKSSRIALGLFHFNVQYEVGVPESYHRYTREAINPFVHTLHRSPNWGVSLAMSGSCLEFVADHYSKTFDTLAEMVHSGRVELISSLYTPAIWVAYPWEELARSIDENIRCLECLGLPQSRFFLSQEIFFGEGLRRLIGTVDAAICKDDYLTHFYDWQPQSPVAESCGLPVVVGSNHLLNHLNHFLDDTEVHQPGTLPSTHQRLLDWAREKNQKKQFPASKGEIGDLEWYWYHIGSGHHSCVPWNPVDIANFHFDPSWHSLVLDSLSYISAAGFEMTTISNWFDKVGRHPRQRLPQLVEGSLNSADSGGVLAWMGREENTWEDNDAVLARASRSRIQLRSVEAVLSETPESTQSALQAARKAQMLAEGSDSLGWQPTPREVQYGLQASGDVLSVTSQILDACGKSVSDVATYQPPRLGRDSSRRCVSSLDHVVSSVGIDCESISITQDCDGVTMLEADFLPKSRHFGMLFSYCTEFVSYCPSGLERTLLRVPLDRLRPPEVCLPLANGLLRIQENLYVVKDLRYCHVAARIKTDAQVAEFAITASDIPVRRYRWRFFALTGASAESAMDFANTLNRCGT